MATFKDVNGRSVVASDTAETIGSVRGLVVDAETRAITAIHIAGSGDKASMLAWDDVTAFGADAVMANRADSVRPPADDTEIGVARGDNTLPGTRVLSAHGQSLGTATDAEFDTSTGTVTSVKTERGEFSGDALRAVGRYAIIVDSEVEVVPLRPLDEAVEEPSQGTGASAIDG